MKKLLLTVLLPVALGAKASDSTIIKSISDEMLQNGQAYEQLRYLCKKIGHRLSGSDAYNKATQWGLKTLKQVGADTAWLQPCMVPNWKRGKGDTAYIVGGKPLSILALGNSHGGNVTADIWVVQSFEELDAHPEKAKGKIVVYDCPFEQAFVNTFDAYSKNVNYRGAGAIRAAKYGAVAVLVRSMTHATDNFPHTGALRYEEGVPKIPAAAIGLESLVYLKAQYAKGATRVHLHTHGIMQPDVQAYNVVAELKGTENPNVYITVGGHLDSWDVGEGAHDDGAGIVQTIEILRTFKALGIRPKHTIRFVLFANEENGLRGGSAYTAIAKQNNEKHLFALESDAGGFTPRTIGFTMSATQLAKVQSWHYLLAPYGIQFMVNGGGGADIGPLNSIRTPLAGMHPDSQRYFDVHHTDADVFEKVNRRELLLGAVNMAALIYLVDQYGL